MLIDRIVPRCGRVPSADPTARANRLVAPDELQGGA